MVFLTHPQIGALRGCVQEKSGRRTGGDHGTGGDPAPPVLGAIGLRDTRNAHSWMLAVRTSTMAVCFDVPGRTHCLDRASVSVPVVVRDVMALTSSDRVVDVVGVHRGRHVHQESPRGYGRDRWRP